MLLRRLLMTAARHAATNPRVKAGVKRLYDENARPVIEQKARAMKQMAAERPAGEHPVRFVGRAFKKLLDG
ncbi:MAG: hypothetical protein GDA49_00140 [Rhodospirillales bacterium]|nr:hypothetical protein [Rhodospirillales bacterium]